jgi:hypothetical protein
MKSPALHFVSPPVALPVTVAQLLALGIPQSAIDANEMRGEVKSHGPWQIPVSFRALCVSSVFGASLVARPRLSETVYGIRTLSKPRACGHELEGRVSVNGKNVRGFTSSQLFALTDKPDAWGKPSLFNCATIHACVNS